MILRLSILAFILSFSNTYAAYTKGGCAWRTAAMGFVKVYEICMHSGKGQPEQWKEAFSEKPTYEFKLKMDFHYDVSGEKAAKAFAKSLKEHPAKDEGDQIEREKFIEWVNKGNLAKGSVLTMIFDQKSSGIPAKIEQTFGRYRSSYKVNNSNTAMALAKIYLGNPPFQKKMKKALLQRTD